MPSKWSPSKHRKDTRERFKERVENRTIFNSPSPKPWYRQRHNFFPFLMLFVFIVLIMIVKAVYNVQNIPVEDTPIIEQPIDDYEPMDAHEPMDYETAKKIFGG